MKEALSGREDTNYFDYVIARRSRREPVGEIENAWMPWNQAKYKKCKQGNACMCDVVVNIATSGLDMLLP